MLTLVPKGVSSVISSLKDGDSSVGFLQLDMLSFCKAFNAGLGDPKTSDSTRFRNFLACISEALDVNKWESQDRSQTLVQVIWAICSIRTKFINNIPHTMGYQFTMSCRWLYGTGWAQTCWKSAALWFQCTVEMF